MKNKQIIDSWNKIEPDSTAKARMLGAILTRNKSGRSLMLRGKHHAGPANASHFQGRYEIKRELTMNRPFNWNRFVPVIASLVLVIALFGVVTNNAGWFTKNVYTTEVDGGMISFYKADVTGSGSLDIGMDVTTRDLTAEENRILFGDFDVTSYGMFSSENQALLHVEGRIGVTKVLLAAPGFSSTDTVIDSDIEVSELNGVPVSAGYFITKANSQGIKNMIYFASFSLEDVAVSVELGGEESNSEPLRNEIASVIEQLIQNGTIDMSMITK